MHKKILFLTIAIFTLFFLAPPKAHADPLNIDYCNARSGDVVNLETWYSGKCYEGLGITNTDPNSSPMTGQYRGFSDIVLLDLYSKLTGEYASPLDPVTGFKPDQSLLSSITFLTTKVIITPPASSTDYLASIRDNLQKHSLVRPAYAQEGFGFTALQPVLKAWQGMRNIAYSAYILVFLLYGFMIMFRVKLDPKVVTSFELAIPKLIFTLLLITFSYAIAGLLIDLSYLISLIVGTALETAGLINFGGITLQGFNITATADMDLLSARNLLTSKGLGFMTLGFITAFKIFLSDSITHIVSLITGLPQIVFNSFGLISLIVKIILILALVYVMFKIFFMFLQAYAKIILTIVFSPVILLGNVMPGSDAFGGWVRGLIAELSVFPTTIIVMMISATFISTGISLGPNIQISPGETPFPEGTSIWTPPGFGGPLTTGGNQGASALIGYAILLLAPKIADMIKDALSVKPFKYGAAIGEGLTFGVTGPITGYSAASYAQKGKLREAAQTMGGLFGMRMDLGKTPDRTNAPQAGP